MGAANSSSVVRYFGAKAGLLTPEEIEDFIREKSGQEPYFVRKMPCRTVGGKVKSYSFFLAGIIQGSIRHEAVHCQDYRRALRDIIERRRARTARVYCPVENHPESLGYDDAKASRVFFDHIEWSRRVDCLVAYLPEASMGTAVEMYAAREAGRAVVDHKPARGQLGDQVSLRQALARHGRHSGQFAHQGACRGSSRGSTAGGR